MIVPMSKLSILIYHKEKKEFLSSLQEIGIIHIVENQEAVNADSVSETYKSADTLSKSCDRVALILSKIKKQNVNQIVMHLMFKCYIMNH